MFDINAIPLSDLRFSSSEAVLSSTSSVASTESVVLVAFTVLVSLLLLDLVFVNFDKNIDQRSDPSDPNAIITPASAIEPTLRLTNDACIELQILILLHQKYML